MRQPTPDILAGSADILGDVLSGRPANWNREMDYPLDRITVGRRLRPLGDITGLAESIRQIGLLNRVVLLPDGTLVAGYHRVEAVRSLGWTTIPARIIELDDIDAELAEIDENLRRVELTILEQAEHLLRREELLLAKGLRYQAGDNQYRAGGDTMSPLHSTSDIADMMSISERSAQRRLQIARGLSTEARDAIRSTELANSTSQLLDLVRQPADKHLALIDLVVSGKAPTVADATLQLQASSRALAAAPVANASAPRAEVWYLEGVVRTMNVYASELRQAAADRGHYVRSLAATRVAQQFAGAWRERDLVQALNNVAAQMEDNWRPPSATKLADTPEAVPTPTVTYWTPPAAVKAPQVEPVVKDPLPAAEPIKENGQTFELPVAFAEPVQPPPTPVQPPVQPPVSRRDDYDGDEWYTPDEVIDAARQVLGEIDLDPASCVLAQEVVQAIFYFDKDTDGLAHQWWGRVWLNPPYSSPQAWIDKLTRSYRTVDIEEALVLVNNATETAWFQNLLGLYPCLFFSSRLAFWRHDHSNVGARQGQALFYLGSHFERFEQAFSGMGIIVEAKP